MIVDSALYQNGIRVEGPADISDLVDVAKRDGGFVWLGLSEPSQEEFDLVVGELNFHPIAVEDAISAQQRPKIEDYDGLTFFVLKTVFFNQSKSEITTGELMCFINSHFIVTVRHGEGSPLATVRQDLELKPEHLALGPYAVLHAVLDRAIDGYTAIATALEHEVTHLENKVFSGKRQTFSQDIYFLKREFIEFRHAIEPLTAPVRKVASENFEPVPTTLKPFFRDTLDHLQRACETAAERRCEEDFRVGRSCSGSNHDRRNLRNELPSYARAGLPVWIPHCHRCDGFSYRLLGKKLQEIRMAIDEVISAMFVESFLRIST